MKNHRWHGPACQCDTCLRCGIIISDDKPRADIYRQNHGCIEIQKDYENGRIVLVQHPETQFLCMDVNLAQQLWCALGEAISDLKVARI